MAEDSGQTNLFLWNPDCFRPEEFDNEIKKFERGEKVRWSCDGAPRRIRKGNRAYLLRTGSGGGIVGQGEVVSDSFEDAHWKAPNKRANYVWISFSALSKSPIVPGAKLPADFRTPQKSGTTLTRESATRFDRLWGEAMQPAGGDKGSGFRFPEGARVFGFRPESWKPGEGVSEREQHERFAEVVANCVKHKCVPMGWGKDLNLTKWNTRLKGRLKRRGESPQAIAMLENYRSLKVGDFVVLPQGKFAVNGIGRVTVPYIHRTVDLNTLRRKSDRDASWWNGVTRVEWIPNSAGYLGKGQPWPNGAFFGPLGPEALEHIEQSICMAEGTVFHDDDAEDATWSKAVARLRSVYEQRHVDSELMGLIEAEGEVQSRFGPLFRPGGVSLVTEEQFRAFLSMKNNRHWTGLERLGGIAKDMSKLRRALAELVDESKPLQRRIDALKRGARLRISKLDKAILTPILHVAYPRKYGVWNKTTQEAMTLLGVWPDIRGSELSGATYKAVNDRLGRLAQAVGVNLWILDALLWRAVNSDERNAPKDTRNGSINRQIRDTLQECRTHAVLLFGPAGVGKTFRTGEVADLYRAEGGMVETVQFHPAYAYEDFIIGLKAEPTDSGVAFTPKNGVFKAFCDKARREDAAKDHLFVIDEINRGNIAKVFGELMYCLEYRVKPGDQPPTGREGKPGWVKLPYADEGAGNATNWFAIPENVHILGTMNSSDRSIATLDVALRRRFQFVELAPDPDLLQNTEAHDLGLDGGVRGLMEAINHRILARQGRHKLLGHSYFMPRDYEGADEAGKWTLEAFKDRWFHQILPLLEEYFVDDVEGFKFVIGDRWGVFHGTHFVPTPAQEMPDKDFREALKAIHAPPAETSRSARDAAAEQSEDE